MGFVGGNGVNLAQKRCVPTTSERNSLWKYSGVHAHQAVQTFANKDNRNRVREGLVVLFERIDGAGVLLGRASAKIDVHQSHSVGIIFAEGVKIEVAQRIGSVFDDIDAAGLELCKFLFERELRNDFPRL